MIMVLGHAFGLVGVAWGAMVGYAVKAITASYLAQRVHPLTWPYRSVITALVVVTLLGSAGSITQGHASFIEVLGLLLMACFIMAGIAWSIVFNREERLAVRRILSERLGG